MERKRTYRQGYVLRDRFGFDVRSGFATGLQNGSTPLEVCRIFESVCGFPSVYIDMLSVAERTVSPGSAGPPWQKIYIYIHFSYGIAGLISGRYIHRLLCSDSSLPLLTRMSAVGQLLHVLRAAKHPLYASPVVRLAIVSYRFSSPESR